MYFVNPELLWLIPIIVTADFVCLILAAKKRKEMLKKLLGENAENPAALHLSRPRRVWRNLLMLASLILLIAAAARPCRSYQLRTQEAKGRDILVLFDVSKSMNATDLPPSRLEHAKMMLSHLAEQAPEDRFGLVAFAGTAYLSCPLTSDPATFNEYVRELSTDTIPVGGTNIESALIVAERAFKAAESGNRALLLLTDGEELQGDAKRLTAELRKRHIPLFIAGLGDPDTGAPIPVQEESGARGVVRDAQGKIVTTKLNEKTLSQLARETGGIYVRSTAIRPGTELFRKALERLDRAGKEKISRRIPVDDFPKLLTGCALLLLLYLLISERGGTLFKKSGALIVLGALTLGAAEPAAGKPKQEAPQIPKETTACYNLARSMQESRTQGFEPLYEEVLKRENVPSGLRSSAFHNLGAAQHNNLRTDYRKAVAALRAQQLDQSLKELGEAEKKGAGAEELYRSSAATGEVHALGNNLIRLASDREQIKQLKKKIEELKKQQQKARDKTKEAQKEQQKNQQNQQKNQQNQQKNQQNKQDQQQNSALDQAKQEAQKLKDQAQNMQQQKLAQDAQKAASELDKAQNARDKKDEKQAQKHIQEALKALGGEQDKDQKKDQPKQQPDSGKDQKQKQTPQPVPQGRPEKQEKDKTETKQLLQMLQDEEKELRDAIRRKNRMRRAPVEKDW